MGSVSTIYNGVRQKLAGRALMDVAFSSTSTNGVQNKVIKAKFDEVEADLSNVGDFVEATIAGGTVADGGTIATITLDAGTWLVNGYTVAPDSTEIKTAIRSGSSDYHNKSIILVLASSTNITLENANGASITSYADKRFTNLQAVRIK